MRADVAVVGAGIIGALAAYELAKRGVAVALLDAEKEGAATLASAGMLAPYPEGLSGELLEAGLYGLARYPELLAELRERGLEVEAGFSGTWVAALSLGEKEAWQAQDPLPYPVRGGLGARRFPGGFVHPKALREALLEAFRGLGGPRGAPTPGRGGGGGGGGGSLGGKGPLGPASSSSPWGPGGEGSA